MNYIVIFLVFIIFLIINNKSNEHFSGIGKSFGTYYHPEKCCKKNSCYPGMYLGNDFFTLNRSF